MLSGASNPDLVIFETTREAWLNRLVALWRPYFDRLGYKLPKQIWISVGKPNRGAKAIGMCHAAKYSDDGGTHIFVHPVLIDPIRVGGVVAHELCHAALDCEGGHGGEFKRLATAFGLVGPMRKTLEGPAFIAMMEGILQRIGPYPHAALRENQPRKKRHAQRLIKVQCEVCKFCFWASAKWLKVITPPTCLNPDCDEPGGGMVILWPERETGQPIFERPGFEV